MSDISIATIIVSLIFIGTGMFYAHRCWILWNSTTISGIGIVLTKDKSFLKINFILVMVIGALTGLHILYVELAEHFGLLSAPFWSVFYMVYYLKIIGIMSAFLILANSWHKLLLKVNHWDRHWIK